MGFDYYDNQQGSTAQLDSILARLTQAEAENARLSSELHGLRQSTVPQVPLHVAPAILPAVESRLTALELAGDLETVTLGTQTFKIIQDCETFLYLHVPNNVLRHGVVDPQGGSRPECSRSSAARAHRHEGWVQDIRECLVIRLLPAGSTGPVRSWIDDFKFYGSPDAGPQGPRYVG